MTVAGWVIFFALCTLVVIVSLVIGFSISDDARGFLALFVAFPVCICIFFGMRWYFTGTESGKRALKTQESNFEGGINRSVRVYDAIGNLLQEYEGRFDVDFDGDEQRILFDDEHGMRHVIYFKTGTVIVEEIS